MVWGQVFRFFGLFLLFGGPAFFNRLFFVGLAVSFWEFVFSLILGFYWRVLVHRGHPLASLGCQDILCLQRQILISKLRLFTPLYAPIESQNFIPVTRIEKLWNYFFGLHTSKSNINLSDVFGEYFTLLFSLNLTKILILIIFIDIQFCILVIFDG